MVRIIEGQSVRACQRIQSSGICYLILMHSVDKTYLNALSKNILHRNILKIKSRNK